MADDLPTLPPGPGPILSTGLRLIQERLAVIPPNKSRVLVFYRERDGTIGTGFAIRAGDHWSFVGDLGFKLHEDPSVFVGFQYVS